MARLRPGIREEDEGAVDRSSVETRDEVARIAPAQPDVGEALLVDGGEEFGDAVDEGFGADKAGVAMESCLPGEVFAAAEADFEPDTPRGGAEEGCGEALRRMKDALAKLK